MLSVEPLEDRLTPSAGLQGTTLVVRGDDPVANRIVVSRVDADTVQSDVSGVVRQWDGVTFVRFFGNVGGDWLENATDLPCTTQGGAGDDVLIGGSGMNSLQAFHGNDVVCAVKPGSVGVIVASADAALGFRDLIFTNFGHAVLRDANDLLVRLTDEEAAGFVCPCGCLLDSDGDGVPDLFGTP